DRLAVDTQVNHARSLISPHRPRGPAQCHDTRGGRLLPRDNDCWWPCPPTYRKPPQGGVTPLASVTLSYREGDPDVTSQAIPRPDDRNPHEGPTDGSLMDQLVATRSPEAFAALMERHGPYVLGLCHRLTSCAHDAEDVFQACFLELVRHA